MAIAPAIGAIRLLGAALILMDLLDFDGSTMTPTNLQTALQTAFTQCEAAGLPLDDRQKQILLQTAIASLNQEFDPEAEDCNPLAELTPLQRQVLLEFVNEQMQQQRSWKVQLLNDWLEGNDSGAIQFVRETYGLQWLDQIQPKHLAHYLDAATMSLKVGDRIEVANNLWEWVQDEGPCSREWFACTIVAIAKLTDDSGSLPESYTHYTTCTVRFENGMEYEIQGMHEWNQYNWRLAS